MLLAGIMFCETCGRIMTSFRNKVVYGVQTYRYVPKYRCNSVYFPKENLCVGETNYLRSKEGENRRYTSYKTIYARLEYTSLWEDTLSKLTGR